MEKNQINEINHPTELNKSYRDDYLSRNKENQEFGLELSKNILQNFIKVLDYGIKNKKSIESLKDDLLLVIKQLNEVKLD